MSRAVNESPGIGTCAQVACVWEATARKVGNVHRFADFDDLTYLDFVLSGLAIAPELNCAPGRAVGETVLAAVRATRAVCETNSNLGIVLLLAPLAKCPVPPGALPDLRQALPAVLEALTVADAVRTYEAIRLARPGGLGSAPDQDVADEPTMTLRDVMGLAAERDRVALQYVTDFADVFDVGVPALLRGWEAFGSAEAAIICCQLRLLADVPDTLIARKRGPAEAAEASRRARAVLDAGGLASEAGRSELGAFDKWLRAVGHARNPGTTADLVTASLFVALRERRMDVMSPFPCPLL